MTSHDRLRVRGRPCLRANERPTTRSVGAHDVDPCACLKGDPASVRRPPRRDSVACEPPAPGSVDRDGEDPTVRERVHDAFAARREVAITSRCPESQHSSITQANDIEVEARHGTSRRFEEDRAAVGRPCDWTNAFAPEREASSLRSARRSSHEMDVVSDLHTESQTQRSGCPRTGLTERDQSNSGRGERQCASFEATVEGDVPVAGRPVDRPDRGRPGEIEARTSVGPHKRVLDVHYLRSAE